NKKVLEGRGGERLESVKPKIKSIDWKEKERKFTGFEEPRQKDQKKTSEQIIDELELPEEDSKNNKEYDDLEESSSTGTNDKNYDSKKSNENQGSIVDKHRIISSKQRYICIDKEN